MFKMVSGLCGTARMRDRCARESLATIRVKPRRHRVGTEPPAALARASAGDGWVGRISR
ncbi:MAG: hypothetical protein ACE5G0_07810 [Rhodothermales bacterium]